MLSEKGYGVGVFIGGMEGVIDEFHMFREMHRQLPVLPIASTGAAAKLIYDMEPMEKPELVNELTYATLFRRLIPIG